MKPLAQNSESGKLEESRSAALCKPRIYSSAIVAVSVRSPRRRRTCCSRCNQVCPDVRTRNPSKRCRSRWWHRRLPRIRRRSSTELGDDPRRPRFIETVVGKGYRFIAPVEQENPRREIESAVPSAARADTRDGSEIRLRRFSVEAAAGPPILTCEVVVSNIHLGRIPLMELELPADVTFPLKAKDRLLLKLHGVRVTL